MKLRLAALAFALTAAILITPAGAQAAAKKKAAPAPSYNGFGKAPYIGAICVDADTGAVLFEDKADEIGYPASMVKIMDLLVLLDLIDQGKLKLDDQVVSTAEACRMGGSGVYLKENEVFSVDELLYAMMVQSANDAATALAIHVAGSKEGFVQLMNQKAAELGMKSTTFVTPHGLPPDRKDPEQKRDLTTARDMAILCRAIVKRPDALRYTATESRWFGEGVRPKPTKNKQVGTQIFMENHNNLVGKVAGCDGIKTGYYEKAGYSVAATALRNDRRVIAVVLGTMLPDGDKNASRRLRDTKVTELLNTGFVNLPPLPPPAPVVTNAPPAPVEEPRETAGKGFAVNWGMVGGILAGLVIGIWIAGAIMHRRSRVRDL